MDKEKPAGYLSWVYGGYEIYCYKCGPVYTDLKDSWAIFKNDLFGFQQQCDNCWEELDPDASIALPLFDGGIDEWGDKVRAKKLPAPRTIKRMANASTS